MTRLSNRPSKIAALSRPRASASARSHSSAPSAAPRAAPMAANMPWSQPFKGTSSASRRSWGPEALPVLLYGAMLKAPGFHHLHLNSVDPETAIDFYVRQFPASAKTSWGGPPALAAPNDVLVLFTRVPTAPATSPQTAIWHFGWHVTDTRASLESYQARPDVELLRAMMIEGPSREAIELVEIA